MAKTQYTKAELEAMDAVKLRAVAKEHGAEFAGQKPAQIIANIEKKGGVKGAATAAPPAKTPPAGKVAAPPAKTAPPPAAAKAAPPPKGAAAKAPPPVEEPPAEEEPETDTPTRAEFDALTARIEAIEAQIAAGAVDDNRVVAIGPEDVAGMDIAQARKCAVDFGIEFTPTTKVEALRKKIIDHMEASAPAAASDETPEAEELPDPDAAVVGGEEPAAEEKSVDDFELPASLVDQPNGYDADVFAEIVDGAQFAVWAPNLDGFDERVLACEIRDASDSGNNNVSIYTPIDNSEAVVHLDNLFRASVLAPKARPPVPAKKGPPAKK